MFLSSPDPPSLPNDGYYQPEGHKEHKASWQLARAIIHIKMWNHLMTAASGEM